MATRPFVHEIAPGPWKLRCNLQHLCRHAVASTGTRSALAEEERGLGRGIACTCHKLSFGDSHAAEDVRRCDYTRRRTSTYLAQS